ncbi:MAG: nuclear transport factor 2 family protein [Phycisphaeraceae bacterium]|nr:nuclear transport factor 2 family protein [Phycisphaeraceae bacterium]
MAKKKNKKPEKASGKGKKESAKKGSGGKAKKGGKSKGTKQPKNPRPITTGKGKPVAEIAAATMAHLRSGKPDSELWGAHFSSKFMSIEGSGQGWKGVKAVKQKCDEWMSQHEIHGVQFEGPYVGATGFAVKYTLDVTNNASGQRFSMSEVGVYTVEKGKVVQEEFMYFCPTDGTADAPAS